MLGIIDTSSLIAITRYYTPIKDETPLLRQIETWFRSREIIYLSKISEETENTQKGIATKRMEFFKERELIYDDSDLLPPAPQKFSNLLDNNLNITIQKKRLTAEQFSEQKKEYMSTGDAKLIIYALNNMDKDPIIITEETAYSNDSKLFKKIPAICDFLGIKHQTIAEWIASKGITVNWAVDSTGAKCDA